MDLWEQTLRNITPIGGYHIWTRSWYHSNSPLPIDLKEGTHPKFDWYIWPTVEWLLLNSDSETWTDPSNRELFLSGDATPVANEPGTWCIESAIPIDFPEQTLISIDWTLETIDGEILEATDWRRVDRSGTATGTTVPASAVLDNHNSEQGLFGSTMQIFNGSGDLDLPFGKNLGLNGGLLSILRLGGGNSCFGVGSSIQQIVGRMENNNRLSQILLDSSTVGLLNAIGLKGRSTNTVFDAIDFLRQAKWKMQGGSVRKGVGIISNTTLQTGGTSIQGRSAGTYDNSDLLFTDTTVQTVLGMILSSSNVQMTSTTIKSDTGPAFQADSTSFQVQGGTVQAQQAGNFQNSSGQFEDTEWVTRDGLIFTKSRMSIKGTTDKNIKVDQKLLQATDSELVLEGYDRIKAGSLGQITNTKLVIRNIKELTLDMGIIATNSIVEISNIEKIVVSKSVFISAEEGSKITLTNIGSLECEGGIVVKNGTLNVQKIDKLKAKIFVLATESKVSVGEISNFDVEDTMVQATQSTVYAYDLQKGTCSRLIIGSKQDTLDVTALKDLKFEKNLVASIDSYHTVLGNVENCQGDDKSIMALALDAKKCTVYGLYKCKATTICAFSGGECRIKNITECGTGTAFSIQEGGTADISGISKVQAAVLFFNLKGHIVVTGCIECSGTTLLKSQGGTNKMNGIENCTFMSNYEGTDGAQSDWGALVSTGSRAKAAGPGYQIVGSSTHLHCETLGVPIVIQDSCVVMDLVKAPSVKCSNSVVRFNLCNIGTVEATNCVIEWYLSDGTLSLQGGSILACSSKGQAQVEGAGLSLGNTRLNSASMGINFISTSGIDVESPSSKWTGNIEHSGLMDTAGDHVINGIAFSSHVHAGVESGSSETTPPV